MSRRQKQVLVLTAIIILVGLAFLIRGLNKDRSSNNNTPVNNPVKIGYLNIVACIPLLIAKDEGIFDRNGLNVELVEFKTGNEVATAAITGQIDVIGGAATNAVLDSSVESKKGFKIFLINNYIRRDKQDQSSDFLLGQPEIKSVQELRGKKVAIYPGSVGRAFASLVFPKYGLKPEDLELVELGPAQWQAAMAARQVDAVTALEPFATTILESMNTSILISGYYSSIMKRVPASGSWFIDGKLSHEQEGKVFSSMREAAQIINNDRSKAVNVLINRMKMPTNLAEKVRLLEWASSEDEGVEKELIEYLDILQSNGVVRFKGDPGTWIWHQ